MDTSKPVGDACREDGTLKDASEMEWPDLPTEHNCALIEAQFDDHNLNGSEMERPPSTRMTESEPEEEPKAKVRYINGSFFGHLLILWLANQP